MKGITKTIEPQEFTDWKNQANENWTPKFADLRNPEKAKVRTSLLTEQGFICAYCCSEIKDDSKSTVIEHFIPQSIDEKVAIDYNNLFACCDGTKTDGKSKTQIYCCDESKKDQFRDPKNPTIQLIKPTATDENGFICEQAFCYTFEGGIFSADTAFKYDAGFTIKVLNLENSELRRQRAETCAFLFDENNELFNFLPEEIEKLTQYYQNKNIDSKFQPFCHVVLYFLNNYYQLNI